MKHITAPFITNTQPIQVSHVGDILERNQAQWHLLQCNNWPQLFPYTPNVRFRLAHTGNKLILQFAVNEKTVRATESCGGRVWEDSCCEMFISFNGQDYYNLECNARGAFLISMAPTARSAGYRQTTSSTSSSHNLRSEAILSTKCRLRPSGNFHSSSPSRLSSAMTSTLFPEPKRASISTSAATGSPPCTSSPGHRSPRPSPTSIVRKTLA